MMSGGGTTMICGGLQCIANVSQAGGQLAFGTRDGEINVPGRACSWSIAKLHRIASLEKPRRCRSGKEPRARSRSMTSFRRRDASGTPRSAAACFKRYSREMRKSAAVLKDFAIGRIISQPQATRKAALLEGSCGLRHQAWHVARVLVPATRQRPVENVPREQFHRQQRPGEFEVVW